MYSFGEIIIMNHLGKEVLGLVKDHDVNDYVNTIITKHENNQENVNILKNEPYSSFFGFIQGWGYTKITGVISTTGEFNIDCENRSKERNELKQKLRNGTKQELLNELRNHHESEIYDSIRAEVIIEECARRKLDKEFDQIITS